MRKHVLSKEIGKHALFFNGFLLGCSAYLYKYNSFASIVGPIKSLCELIFTIATVLIEAEGYSNLRSYKQSGNTARKDKCEPVWSVDVFL